MCALGPLAPAERARYYSGIDVALAALFGFAPIAALPADWQAFIAYNHSMHESDELGVSDSARAMAHNLLAGAGSWVRPPHWYRALNAEWLPERFRHEFALDFDVREQRAAARARVWLPRIYKKLPRAIRFIGPWREAQARLAPGAQVPSPA